MHVCNAAISFVRFSLMCAFATLPCAPQTHRGITRRPREKAEGSGVHRLLCREAGTAYAAPKCYLPLPSEQEGASTAVAQYWLVVEELYSPLVRNKFAISEADRSVLQQY